MSFRLFVTIGLVLLFTRAQAAPMFEDGVEIILRSNCHECHNPNRRKGDLDLSTASGLLRGSESGPIIKAGDPEHSLLYELTHSGAMPKKKGKLSTEEIATIRDWINTGAGFRNPPAQPQTSLHQHDVIPIMLLRCVTCHGARKQDGGLDLRTPASMLKGGKSGPAFVAGDPDASRMIQRIESEACPPQALLLKYFVKRPPTVEIDKLRKWIAEGATVKDIQPDVATTAPDPLVSEEDRQHWSFHPPAKHIEADGIDSFIQQRLRAAGLDFSPSANRNTLIRRSYLDLTGLPPSPTEAQRWRRAQSVDWFANMTDHLLASPRYGERWGRYWLDLAGYADSEGGVSSDPLREVAWKYRDYVIQAFNEDKPYDRFLIEQLAGDELVDHENAATISDEMVNNLVATGFLRMGIDQTGSRTMNFVPERLGVIGDAITVIGSGVMGLTLECARCHSHKYDPIPHRDYYRLKAVFQGALDEHDWLSFKTRSIEVATKGQITRIKKNNPPLLTEKRKLEARLKQAIADTQLETLRHHYPEQPEEDRKATLVALRRADNTRSLKQRNLVEALLSAELMADSSQSESTLLGRRETKRLQHDIHRINRQLTPTAEIRALWDRGEPSPTYILRRGEYDKPAAWVGPGVPAALTGGDQPLEIKPPFPNGTHKTGRRLAFARWLTEPDNPLTARVMINRIWHHHFGTGLVKTLENFGMKGERPSHPELLDWLARQFIEKNWSIKDMHRLIMNSRTYRQTSRVNDQHLARDPQNRLISRMPLRRMDAEALRDSLLLVSDRLDEIRGGAPDPITVDREGQVSVIPRDSGNWRRSVYLQYRRTEIPTMMATFDYPEMGPNCVDRNESIVSPQSLMLMNGEQVHELSRSLAQRVVDEIGEDASPVKLVNRVYEFALSRAPNREELKIGIDALNELQNTWTDDHHPALATYCHTILNSAAFIYID